MADHDANTVLTEVEPSPIDETPAEFKEGYFPADASNHSSRSAGTNFLGLSQHGTIYWLGRIQQYSTYAFTAFAAAHVRIPHPSVPAEFQTNHLQ